MSDPPNTLRGEDRFQTFPKQPPTRVCEIVGICSKPECAPRPEQHVRVFGHKRLTRCAPSFPEVNPQHFLRPPAIAIASFGKDVAQNTTKIQTCLGTLALIPCLGWILPGCAAPGVLVTAAVPVAELGTSAFANGELSAAYKYPLPQVDAAAEAALAELGFRVLRRDKTERKVYFAAEDSRGTEISLRLDAITAQVTGVRIRVGVFGDQALSRLLLSDIEQRLTAEEGAGGEGKPPVSKT